VQKELTEAQDLVNQKDKQLADIYDKIQRKEQDSQP